MNLRGLGSERSCRMALRTTVMFNCGFHVPVGPGLRRSRQIRPEVSILGW